MIALVKVRWDSKRGPELTWERKDQMRSRELKRNGNVMVIIREVFVKLLLDSFGKLSISNPNTASTFVRMESLLQPSPSNSNGKMIEKRQYIQEQLGKLQVQGILIPWISTLNRHEIASNLELDDNKIVEMHELAFGDLRELKDVSIKEYRKRIK
ncbi:hypothetical protein Tco_1107223 [Tanacetum coccineum]